MYQLKTYAVYIFVVLVLPDRCIVKNSSCQMWRVFLRCECKYAAAYAACCCCSASLTQFKSHSHICACASTRSRRAISLGLNQLSCHANKIKSQRAYDNCTKIIKCVSNERKRQAKPNGEEATERVLGSLTTSLHASRSSIFWRYLALTHSSCARSCSSVCRPLAHLHPFYTCATVCLQSIIEIDLGLWQ